MSPPAGYQELIVTEGQSDLELLQQLEELRHVAVGERFGLGQVLFHLRTLNNAFGRLVQAAALQRQLLHRGTDKNRNCWPDKTQQLHGSVYE